MKYNWLKCVLLLFFTIYSRAQEVDSLIRNNIVDEEIIQNNMSQVMDIYNDIIIQNEKNSNLLRISAFVDHLRFRFKESNEKLIKGIELDKMSSNSIGLAQSYNLLGKNYKATNKTDSAKTYFKKAYSLTKGLNDKYAGRYLLDLSSAYIQESRQDSAQIFLNLAKDFSTAAKDTLTLLSIEEVSNSMLRKPVDFKKIGAIIHSIGKSKNNSFIEALGNSKLGRGYLKEKDSINYAIKYMDSAISYFKSTENLWYLNSIYPTRAYATRWDTLTQVKAMDIYKEQYNILKGTGHVYEGMTAINLAQLNYKQGNIELSKKLNVEVLELSKRMKLQNILIAIANENLSVHFEDQGNYKEALKYYKELYKHEMESYSTKLTDQANKYKIQFETEKKEKENLQLKADKAEQAEQLALESKRKWQLGGGLATALLGLGVFGFYYRRNKKQKNTIEALQKELHHRVKNNLSIIDTFIEVAKEEFYNPKFSDKLSELQNRIDSINEVHQQLYIKEDVTNLNLKKYLDKLAANVANSYQSHDITIENNLNDQLFIPADKSFSIGLIVNEFLTNSFKYAFDDKKGVVRIAMKEVNNCYELKLSDSGKGLPVDFDIEQSESFGLRIIKLLSQQLNGSFELMSNDGVALNIKIPK